VLVMDGTAIRMPYSQANADVYKQAPQQKPGCGFPESAAFLFHIR
jgi:hypothetical protein